MTSELRSGGLIRLSLRQGNLLAWFLPAWSVVCGALASGGLTLTLENGVRLLLGLLLVDVGWGAVWEALATTDWATPIRRWRNWHLGDPPPALLPPYTLPGSPAERVARWLVQLRAWGRGVLAPTAGHALGAIAASLLFSAVLAAALGSGLVLLTLGMLSLVQLALVLEGGQGQPKAGWDGLMRLGLPWLAGHLLFAPLTPSSALIAAAFSAAAVGVGRVGRAKEAIAAWGGQLAVALFLILLRRPLAVPFLIFSLIPQQLLSTWAGDARQTRRAWGWFAASMFLAALVL